MERKANVTNDLVERRENAKKSFWSGKRNEKEKQIGWRWKEDEDVMNDEDLFVSEQVLRRKTAEDKEERKRKERRWNDEDKDASENGKEDVDFKIDK